MSRTTRSLNMNLIERFPSGTVPAKFDTTLKISDSLFLTTLKQSMTDFNVK